MPARTPSTEWNSTISAIARLPSGHLSAKGMRDLGGGEPLICARNCGDRARGSFLGTGARPTIRYANSVTGKGIDMRAQTVDELRGPVSVEPATGIDWHTIVEATTWSRSPVMEWIASADHGGTHHRCERYDISEQSMPGLPGYVLTG